MRLKLILICLLFSSFGKSFSQGLYWSLNTGANFGRTTWGSFQDYSEAYNYQNYDLLKSRLSPMKWTRGYNFGASFIATNESEKGIYKVEKFREKPNLSTAMEYLKEGNYLWNAGIFIWKAKSIIQALKQYTSSIHDLFEAGNPYYNLPEERAFIDEQYPKAPNMKNAISLLY